MSAGDAIESYEARLAGSRRAMAVETTIVFAIFAVAHYLLFGGHAAWTDPDAPYHHLVIAEIHQHGFWRDITWLPHTILREAGPDHHWLWHALLSPFAAIDDIATRIDVVNAFSFALVPASANLALRLLGVRFAPAFVLVMVAGSEWPLYRWSQARAQNPSIVLMLLFMAALARRHKPSLFLIPFVFMHTYHGAAILAAPGAFLFLVRWMREKQPDWLLLVLPATGGALALVTSPWYPHNIEYFLFHTLDKVGNPLGIDVGAEWYGAMPVWLLEGLWPQLLLLAASLAMAGTLLRRQLSSPTLAAAGVSVLLLFMTWRHMRFVEYCPPMLVLTAALVVRDCRERFTGRIKPVLVVSGCVAAALSFALHLKSAGTYLDKPSCSLARNENAAQLLAHFAPAGTLVANTRWGDFPSLVWHAPGLRYLTGLDPYYLVYEDPDRFLALYRLRGMLPANGHEQQDIRHALGSDWLVTNEQPVVKQLVQSGQAKVVMKDSWNFVAYLGEDPAIIKGLLADGTRWMQVAFPRQRHAQEGP